MSGEKDLREELFIAQYREMWEWKRHHTRLFWQIFAGTLVVLGLATRVQISPWFFIPLSFFGIGMVILFLRHNCFQRAASYVINCLEFDKAPITTHSLTSGQTLADFCQARTYNLKWRWLLNPCAAKISWILVAVSVVIYTVFVVLKL